MDISIIYEEEEFSLNRPQADSVFKFQCLWLFVSVSVPSAGYKNFMDWRLLVKERIAKIEKLRNLLLWRF